MTYENLKNALEATGIPFAEGQWVRAGELRDDYGVIAVDGADDLVADGNHTERLVEGTVDLFTRYEPGLTKAAQIEAAMESAAASWRVNSVQVEANGYTHREWVFRCLP